VFDFIVKLFAHDDKSAFEREVAAHQAIAKGDVDFPHGMAAFHSAEGSSDIEGQHFRFNNEEEPLSRLTENAKAICDFQQANNAPVFGIDEVSASAGFAGVLVLPHAEMHVKEASASKGFVVKPQTLYHELQERMLTIGDENMKTALTAFAAANQFLTRIGVGQNDPSAKNLIKFSRKKLRVQFPGTTVTHDEQDDLFWRIIDFGVADSPEYDQYTFTASGSLFNSMPLELQDQVKNGEKVTLEPAMVNEILLRSIASAAGQDECKATLARLTLTLAGLKL
jgi:hypothetical protein